MALAICLYSSIYGQVTADFSVNQSEACEILSADFFDQSLSTAGQIVDWQWTIGSITSTKQNPSTIFNEVGFYDVCLTVQDASGNEDTKCEEAFIKIYKNPTADFSVVDNGLCAPATIEFNDLSASDNGVISNWTWDLGGSTGVLNTSDPNQAVTSNYAAPGEYSISLLIEDEKGCSALESKSQFVEILRSPKPEFTATIISVCELPAIVEIDFTEDIAPATYSWDFGNGETYTGNNPPNVTYNTDGSYDIVLTANDGTCESIITQEINIETNPDLNVEAYSGKACIGNEIILDLEDIAYDSIRWDIESVGSFVSDGPQAVTFNSPGCFAITGLIYSGDCEYNFNNANCIEVRDRPDIQISVDINPSCALPNNIEFSFDSDIIGTPYWRLFEPNGNVFKSQDLSFVYEAKQVGDYNIKLNYVLDEDCFFVYEEFFSMDDFKALLPEKGTSGCIPLDVTLTDSIISTLPIVSYHWEVNGDNNFFFESDDQSPSFTLTDVGLYDVLLIATNSIGCTDTIVIKDYLGSGTPPIADFSFTPPEQCADEGFLFIDESSSEANCFVWEFGTNRGKKTFYGEELVHYFADTGYVDVAHVAKFNGCPSDTVFQENAVYVNGPYTYMEANYNCENPYSIEFIHQSIDADTFEWRIHIDGDTIFKYVDTFDFIFPYQGDFLAELHSQNYRTGCDYLRVDTIKIRDPKANLMVNANQGCVPFTLDLSDNSDDAVEWNYSAPNADIDDYALANPSITYPNPGVFEGPKLVITDIHGCKDSIVYDSIYANSIEAIPLFNEIVCVPDSLILQDGSQSMFADINTWDWKVGDDYHNANTETSVYFLDTSAVLDLQLIVQDSWGCIDTFVQEDIISPVINHLEFEYDAVTCSQDAVNFKNLSTGENIIDYLWEFGDGETSNEFEPNHFYATEGTYSVCLTIFEQRGCERTICKENIIEVINPVADFVADVTSIDCPPLLVNFTNNSINADRYEWDFGDGSGKSLEESPSKVFTSVGNFDVMLIAKRGEHCSDTLIFEDYINIDGPDGDFTFLSDKSCLPLNVQFIGDSDSEYSYTWDFGNGEIVSSTTLSAADTVLYAYEETGVYTPKLILQNNSGCFRSFSGDPIVVNDVDLDFAKHDPYCDTPQSIQLENLSAASTDPDYTWTINSNSVSYDSQELSPTIDFTQAGHYSIKLKAEMENCVDSITVEEAITIGSLPNVQFSIPNDGLCQFAEIALENHTTNAFGQITEYEWDFGDGNTSFDPNPNHTYEENQVHIISLIARTEYGCSSERQMNTEILEAAELEITALDPFCRGDNAQIEILVNNAQDGSTVAWEASSDLSCNDCLDPVVSPSSTGYYYVSYIQENGCVQEDSVYAEFYDIDGPELQLTTDDLICAGDSTLVSITNYNPDYTYTWNSDTNFSSIGSDNSTLLVYPETSLDFGVRVTNEQGCIQENESSVSIETYEAEILTEDKIYCSGQNIALNVSTGNDPVWSGPGLSCSDCPSPFITVGDNAEEFFVSITSDNGCIFSDTMNIQGIPSDFVNAGPDKSICLGEEIQLEGSALGESSWTESDFINDIYDPKALVSPVEDSYFVLYSSIGDCVDSDSVFIEVFENVNMVAQGDTICFSETGIISVDGNAYDYEWTDLRTNEKLENATIHELSPDITTPYMVVGSRSTCIADTQYTEIKVFDEIVFDLTDDYTVFPNKETQVEIDFSGNYSFEWSPREGLSCWTCPDPIFLIEESTEYFLTVTDKSSGCAAESRLWARYEEECTEKAYFLPNIFSPNADGKNDQAQIFAENPTEFISLSIFDRWGEQMFYSEDLDEGWDGLFRGEEAMSGVYVMKIDAICETTNEAYTIYADITLLR